MAFDEAGVAAEMGLPVSRAQLLELQAELALAAELLSERCLYESAKWAAEALNGLGVGDEPEDAGDEPMDTGRYRFADPLWTPAEARKYVLAKTLFDCKEFDRVGTVLASATSNKCLFLRLYARYISGEKKREEQSEVILGPLDGEPTANKQIVTIVGELEQYLRSTTAQDPFLLYLYGIVLRKHKCEKQALEALLRSVNLFPYNWGAWQEIISSVATIDRLPATLALAPKHLMTSIFEVVANQELFQVQERVYDLLTQIDAVFPEFMFLKIQRAILSSHLLDYPDAERLFDEVLNVDPHRLDSMEVYSNILYVTERRAKLAYLAQLASATDKFRPETCCIIANYCSLQSEHEKAVVYYRRALTLNRNFLGAWTLMGHEYIELKNIRAAIESYRRAVGISNKEVRAWYGLGQAYEVIEMYNYSFFYYQRAAALKPYDYRMWQALGNCFEKHDRPMEAIKAYKRALSVTEVDPLLMRKLAELAEKVGDATMAATYLKMYREHVARESARGAEPAAAGAVTPR
ncbi:anaphase promoting complex subunit 8 [Dipodascopsis tothii]|uniref:anaphase promoting complex subunit 8 n=1 Tax=Dipodascopsis tothii TaxID=44089 RepID=UPI0034CE74B7